MLSTVISEDIATLTPPSFSTCLRIGDVGISLHSSCGNALGLDDTLNIFRAHHDTSDIKAHVEWSDSLPPLRGEKVFDSGAIWTLFHDGDELVFDFTSPVFGNSPYKRLRVDSSFRRAHIALRRDVFRQHPSACPLEYPTDELLFTNYLAFHGLGVEVHGCGLVDAKSGGHLFLGHSGAGKSTTARLWNSRRHPEILSDDRIILRPHNGELWMYGTPWHGEAVFASAAKARLSRIFVLQHGKENHIMPLAKTRAVGELFARCFPPFHSAVGLERTIEFLTRVVDTVPCHEFQFVPYESAIRTILSFR